MYGVHYLGNGWKKRLDDNGTPIGYGIWLPGNQMVT